ncbi:hypothetical protein F2Q70_00027323 [Brassica cretica]|uniref:Uncharacterized protein n=1 Tax=Brassica cretica TaxID=69181 RepID=A0A8S9LK79_BRACR|nr:hypothetical protein F2Q70_00027323 [Brassica cretica]
MVREIVGGDKCGRKIGGEKENGGVSTVETNITINKEHHPSPVQPNISFWVAMSGNTYEGKDGGTDGIVKEKK